MNITKIKKYCKDIEEWPKSWEIEEKDVKIGKRILCLAFIPFFEFLINQNLTKETIKKHLDNIWLLGGEIIERLQWDENLRELNEIDLVLEHIDENGGQYSKHLHTESEKNSFDSSCKKFHKYLIKKEHNQSIQRT